MTNGNGNRRCDNLLARNHKSTGKPPSPFKKKSNIACTSIICAQAGADRISTGDSDGALALLPAKAQPEPADCGARCECCSRTALYQDRWLPKKNARQPGNPGTLNKNCLNSGPRCHMHNVLHVLRSIKCITLLFKPPPFS